MQTGIIEPAIGIDLGTTFSCVAVVKNGQVQTIYNGQGNYVTPSWVSFSENEILVGEPARIASAGNSKNTVFNAKRLIGRKFEDWERDYQLDSSHWPFQVVNVDGKPLFRVNYQRRQQTFSPQQISSFVLQDLKKSAEDFLQQPVKNAVITVPANFDYSQRHATEEAAKLAGFNVLRLCSEPAMAGIMHEPLKNIYQKKTMLVFDCGGGTTDVAILSITQDGIYDIMATAGDMYLGGENIVDRLVNHFLGRLKEETKHDYSKNEEAVRRLKRTCEEAKCQLSFADAYTVCFDYQCEPRSWKLTRARFNGMMADLFDRMVNTVEQALTAASISKYQVDEVLLAGGTSRILDIQQRLSNFFEGKPIRKSVNPEQAIAQGAAIMAAVLSGDTSASLTGRQLFEVAPLSLGVECAHEEMTIMVPRGTKLPYSASVILCTARDNQTDCEIEVYEGERFLASDICSGYFGTLCISGFRPARCGEVFFNVTFNVSASGIAEVSAVEPVSGIRDRLEIMSQNRQRDSKAVADMIADAQKNVAVDAMHRERVKELRSFENLIHKRKHREEDEKGWNTHIVEACQAELKWTSENGKATIGTIRQRKLKFEAMYCN